MNGKKTLILLVQLGPPRSPAVDDVRNHLREFLQDPRVLDIGPLVKWPLLNLLVLPSRPKKSAQLYARIWDGEQFPLARITNSFAQKVGDHCPENIEVRPCYLLCPPRFDQHLDYWEQHREEFDKIILAPQFPQYCEATTASVLDQWAKALSRRVVIPPFEFVTNYHRLKSFVDLSAVKIDQAIQRSGGVDGLVLSFHGLPLRRVIEKKDPYYAHCLESFELIARQVKSISRDKITCTFQSRFGREQWPGPATEDFVQDYFAQNQGKRLAVYAPSFVVDCLETVDELGHELQHSARKNGGEILRVDCLNDDENWAQGYAEYLKTVAEGGDLGACCYPERDQSAELAALKKATPESLGPQGKSTIKLVFLTLFLDLVGFSIIFPLFPAMIEYYMAQDADNFLLRWFVGAMGGLSPYTMVVVFGGLLGSLYSLLQFVAAPFWGGVSDHWGRRKTLLVTNVGLAASYLLWIFSGSFTLLVLARILGGLMGGNISVATAAVADVTSPQNRARGMAWVGVAFALGFILGPAFGGLLGEIDLTARYPGLNSWGINPFSLVALFAFGLSCLNIGVIAKKFRETLPRALAPSQVRTSNLWALGRGVPNSLVNRTNGAYFLFICAFSGMEFTLTFLAVERLGYSPMDNAMMFIFIGLLLALVQGGVVRRKAHQVGERKMACLGIAAVIPGLWIVALAHSTVILYLGLGFLSVGSAMIVPCLTALVSLYAGQEIQGRALGIFRSLGALGRVVGPLLACLLYWSGGAHSPYLWGGIFLFLPLLLVARLPAPGIKS